MANKTLITTVTSTYRQLIKTLHVEGSLTERELNKTDITVHDFNRLFDERGISLVPTKTKAGTVYYPWLITGSRALQSTFKAILQEMDAEGGG